MLDICTSWWKLGLDSDSAWLWYKTLVFLCHVATDFWVSNGSAWHIWSTFHLLQIMITCCAIESTLYLVFNLHLMYKASGKRSTKDSQSSNLSFDVWRLKDLGSFLSKMASVEWKKYSFKPTFLLVWHIWKCILHVPPSKTFILLRNNTIHPWSDIVTVDLWLFHPACST